MSAICSACARSSVWCRSALAASNQRCCEACDHFPKPDPEPTTVEQATAMVRHVGLRTNEIVSCFIIGGPGSTKLAGDIAEEIVADGQGVVALQFLAATFAQTMRVLALQNEDDPEAFWRGWCEDDAARAAGLVEPEEGDPA